MKKQVEIERKYDVDAESRVPSLDGVGPVVSTTAEEPVTLRAVYFDTAEHLLLANRITLRRREGGHDAGWHIKTPAGGGARREHHAPLGRDADEPLPAALRGVVEVLLRGRPLHPVLVLETQRTLVTLLGADGERLGELADDEVTATNPDTASMRAWREWEVELAEGVGRADGEALLDAVADELLRAGASVSDSKSKLARGLGDSLPGATAVPLPEEDGDFIVPESAAEFVLGSVAAFIDDLERWDPLAREGAEDGVHRFRTTIRRLRTILRVYRGVIDAEAAAGFESVLAHLGAVAGAARDVEVAGQQLDIDVDLAPQGFVSHDTVARLRATLRERAVDAGRDLVRALSDVSYFELLDRLDALVAPAGIELASGPSADKGAGKFATARIAKESKRARGRAIAASEAYEESGEFDIVALHRARKASRRLRYTIEAQRAAELKGSVGPKAAHAVQDALGDALDAHAASEWYVAAADTARWAGEDAFGYGALATVARIRRDAALDRLPRLAEKL